MSLYDIFRGTCWFVFSFTEKFSLDEIFICLCRNDMIGEERQWLAFLLAEKEIHIAFSLDKHVKRRNLFVANSDNNYLNK